MPAESHETPRLGIANLQHVPALLPLLPSSQVRQAANRCLSLLSKMFNLAEQWNYRAENTNPCRLIQRYAEHKSQRFLTTEELNRFGAVLAEAETDGGTNIYAVATFRLLLLTGAGRHRLDKGTTSKVGAGCVRAGQGVRRPLVFIRGGFPCV